MSQQAGDPTAAHDGMQRPGGRAEASQALGDLIRARTAHVAVLGMGYVGLPLAVEIAQAGYPVTCVDLNPRRVEQLSRGDSYIPDVPSATLTPLVAAGTFRATTDYAALDPAPDIVFICVPTPYNAMKVPDVSYIEGAAATLAGRLRAGQLIILESTTYPGTTDELVQPILETNNDLSARADDYLLAFSPERIDPGNHTFTVHTTPKVVGGLTALAGEMAALFFDTVAPGTVHRVSSPRVAEMTKLLENTFRAVNIALVNEFALLAERMGIDMWEVIDAAATKPFGFSRFTPGPGVGGHCIPVDPYYLSWKAREYDFVTRFIELAAEVNEAMPLHVLTLTQDALNSAGKSLRDAEVVVLGVAFKPNVDDPRNSPAQRVIELLRARGAQVSYHDPYVPTFRVAERPFGHAEAGKETVTLSSRPYSADLLGASDVVVIVTGHGALDYQHVVEHAPLVVDTVNATRGVDGGGQRIWRLGAPPMTRQA